jgi:hypothetical protein
MGSLVVFGFWWYDFFVLASDTRNTSLVSIYAWVTTWNFAVMLNYHPFACRFNTKSGRGRVVVYIVATAALLQWIATCYAFHVKRDEMYHGDVEYPKYRCLESAISQAPGISRCSPQQLCSKKWLFSNDWWISRTPWDSARGHYRLWFFVVSIAPFGFAIWSLYSSRGRRVLNFNYSKTIGFILFATSIPLLFILMLVQSETVLSGFFNPTHPPNREGPVAYDLDCQAVHVYLSPWRNYLDVDDFQRGLRIARMWLNA